MVSHEIVESVIRVDRRMSYTSVKKILDDKDEETCREYEELVPMFELMRELAGILREKRKKRGSIDFDFPESRIILDGQGHPVEIKPYERNVATKIIEDFMLIANETVAEHFHWMELPFVYRTHDNPDPEKISKLGTFIRNFGYSIKSRQEEIHPKELQKLLAKIEDTPEEALISTATATLAYGQDIIGANKTDLQSSINSAILNNPANDTRGRKVYYAPTENAGHTDIYGGELPVQVDITASQVLTINADAIITEQYKGYNLYWDVTTEKANPANLHWYPAACRATGECHRL